VAVPSVLARFTGLYWRFARFFPAGLSQGGASLQPPATPCSKALPLGTTRLPTADLRPSSGSATQQPPALACRGCSDKSHSMVSLCLVPCRAQPGCTKERASLLISSSVFSFCTLFSPPAAPESSGELPRRSWGAAAVGSLCPPAFLLLQLEERQLSRKNNPQGA